MSGIVFLGTRMLEKLESFYLDRVRCRIWLRQADCIVLRHGNLLLGFCEREESELNGCLTFFYDTREEVDGMYRKLQDSAVSPPVRNEKYDIYQFFAKDPEGRTVEFQHFNHRMDGHMSGDELLLNRRSVRKYVETAVSSEVLDQVFELSRFAPTARNTQSYYFKTITDRETLDFLGAARDRSSKPISEAPMAVAICSDPALSKRHVQDGCIGAYHFMLAAWVYGLGTCWIAAMDRDDVKQRLGIPGDHYVVTVTPLGYPQPGRIEPPERKERSWFIRD